MKISKPFIFKQFTVNQDKCALKVNTDAVLLGALAEADRPGSILDIGAGTGVISLMLAQRYDDALVHSVEIESNAYLQAKENYANNPWSTRMKVFNMPFQQMGKAIDTKYDLIVSNPPYYSDHLKTQNHERNIALHSESLSFDELAEGVKDILAEKGQFCAILPDRQMNLLENCLKEKGLYPKTKVTVRDRPGAQTLRVIQSFGFVRNEAVLDEEIIIKTSAGNYSADYASLLKDFLLIF